MTQNAAEILQGAQEFGDLSIYSNYSGRGMFGGKTTGIVGSHHDFFTAISQVIMDGTEEERLEIAELLQDLRTDHMGLDMIYY